MPPKVVDARQRSTRNRRFRGHGPLLQKVARAQGLGARENHWYALRRTGR